MTAADALGGAGRTRIATTNTTQRRPPITSRLRHPAIQFRTSSRPISGLGHTEPDVRTDCPGRTRGRCDRQRHGRGRRRFLTPDASPGSRRTGHLDRCHRDPGGCRDRRPRLQPALDHRYRAFPSTAALGSAGRAGALRSGVQRRGLQLPRTAGRTGRAARRRLHHRRGRRGDRRRLPLLGHRGADPAARHVRVRAVGHRTRRTVLRARSVRYQATVHGHRPGRDRGGQREEMPARPQRRPRPGYRYRYPGAAALHGSAVRARTGDAASGSPATGVGLLRGDPPRPGPGGDPVLPAPVCRRAVPGRRGPRRATTRSPPSWRTRWPSTCGPMSPSGRSCPAASTPPPSPRWPSGTIPG